MAKISESYTRNQRTSACGASVDAHVLATSVLEKALTIFKY